MFGCGFPTNVSAILPHGCLCEGLSSRNSSTDGAGTVHSSMCCQSIQEDCRSGNLPEDLSVEPPVALQSKLCG